MGWSGNKSKPWAHKQDISGASRGQGPRYQQRKAVRRQGGRCSSGARGGGLTPHRTLCIGASRQAQRQSKFVALLEINVTMSMQNLALVHTILVSVEDSFHRNQRTKAQTNLDKSVRLSETKVKRLERPPSMICRDWTKRSFCSN